MRRVAIVFCAALFVGLPTISHAQYNDNDQQNPKEYHDEDSHPLALFADLIYPVGYGLEWLLARPAHWIATDSPVSPVFRPVGGTDASPPPPVPIIPDNTIDQTTTTTPQDWSPTRSPVTINSTVIQQAVPAPATAPQPVTTPPPAKVPPSSSQPVYH